MDVLGTAAEELREAMKSYLDAALAELSERDETYSPDWAEPPPWISPAVAAELAPVTRDALVEAIRVANPDRFATPHADARRYAAKYPPALLRAVVARSRVEHAPPRAASPIADAMIAELINRISAPAWSWRTIDTVADLDAEEVDGRELHGVTIRAVPRRGEYDWGAWQHAVSRELPEAVQMLVEQDVFDIAGRTATSLLVVTDERPIPQHEYFRDPADARMGRVVSAVRVATGATIDVTATCRGEPQFVHQDSPVVQQGEWDSMGAWFRRPMRLTPDSLEGIERLAELLESDISDPLAVALSRYARSHIPAWWNDRIVDLAVAIEASLIGEDAREEITLRICSRAAHLLATDHDPAAAIFDDVSDLYALRSTVVHGGTNAERRWRRFTDRNGFTETLAVDRLTPAFDRLRDLVRRAILARLTLRAASLGRVVWRDREAKVDRALVDPVERESWRSEIRDRCAQLGVPDAWHKAPPLRDLLTERRERDSH